MRQGLTKISHLVHPSALPPLHQRIVSSLAQLVAPTEVVSLSNPATHVDDCSMSLTPKARLAAARRSRHTEAGAPKRDPTFVASAVCESMQSHAMELSTGGHPQVSIGVNYELHRATQRNSASCGCMEGSIPLPGLLKGCAEQNAIGSFAAGGRSYHQIRHVFLCSVPILHGHPADGVEGGRQIRTPCAECWQHLCAVSRMVHRCSSGSEALALHVIAVDHRRSLGSGAHVPSYWWDSSLMTASQARGDHCPHMSFILATSERPPA